MTDGLVITSTAFDNALARLALTSKRAAVDVMKQQARLVFANVAKYTPPASQGVTGKQAEKQGKAKVAADIRSLYGTPGDAYNAIANQSPAQAAAFWFMHEAGDDRAASDLVRTVTGKTLSPFDGGTLHGRTARGRWRRSTGWRKHVFYVSDVESLNRYIEEEQSHVWWLASGWKEALAALGARLPHGVDKLNGPGRLRVEITDQRIEIAMTNDVSYGRAVRDIERRIVWAMNIQTAKLDRAWNNYIARAGREAGFKSQA